MYENAMNNMKNLSKYFHVSQKILLFPYNHFDLDDTFRLKEVKYS